ncbi:hypothetical protein Pst134EB_022182 [Puccinia striiformis f. sp. tritici]|nr:hypothetical protein Pst134EB_022182 [Puccinia striiformis f. sp. tritici]
MSIHPTSRIHYDSNPKIQILLKHHTMRQYTIILVTFALLQNAIAFPGSNQKTAPNLFERGGPVVCCNLSGFGMLEEVQQLLIRFRLGTQRSWLRSRWLLLKS